MHQKYVVILYRRIWEVIKIQEKIKHLSLFKRKKETTKPKISRIIELKHFQNINQLKNYNFFLAS